MGSRPPTTEGIRLSTAASPYTSSTAELSWLSWIPVKPAMAPLTLASILSSSYAKPTFV